MQAAPGGVEYLREHINMKIHKKKHVHSKYKTAERKVGFSSVLETICIIGREAVQ